MGHCRCSLKWNCSSPRRGWRWRGCGGCGGGDGGASAAVRLVPVADRGRADSGSCRAARQSRTTRQPCCKGDNNNPCTGGTRVPLARHVERFAHEQRPCAASTQRAAARIHHAHLERRRGCGLDDRGHSSGLCRAGRLWARFTHRDRRFDGRRLAAHRDPRPTANASPCA
jgi:hypothetical protein